MHIKKLFLNNYRNFEFLDIQLDKGINIFFGQNAQGKTNIIESIYLLSTARSHRTQRDKELIRWNNEEAKVSISLEKDKQDFDLEMLLSQNVKKQIKINGVRLKKSGDLLGNLNTVIFSPDHMKMIKEGPIERRRFIDIILSQSMPGYYYNLTQYLKVLEQRNKLLYESKLNPKIISSIDVWDEQLVIYGAKIIKERLKFIEIISKFAYENHLSITNGKENFKIKYSPSINFSKQGLEDTIRNVLEYYRESDIKRGITQRGPHRDDLLFFINDKEVKNYGSQGQQRTALLSLKISELKFIEQETSEMPILLLDDVFSELDRERQKYLINFIQKVQTIITCTDVQYFKNLDIKEFVIFEVNNGKVRKSVL